mmetsp:Transcript_1864/g.3515  ORF Transcript_1864/g.3515 Transcript_1864/m.3515 type:complete len:90 (-) Transcript_1864:89-358(-)
MISRGGNNHSNKKVPTRAAATSADEAKPDAAQSTPGRYTRMSETKTELRIKILQLELSIPRLLNNSKQSGKSSCPTIPSSHEWKAVSGG